MLDETLTQILTSLDRGTRSINTRKLGLARGGRLVGAARILLIKEDTSYMITL